MFQKTDKPLWEADVRAWKNKFSGKKEKKLKQLNMTLNGCRKQAVWEPR